MRSTIRILAVFFCATAAVASAQSTPYTWTPVIPALTTARADACAFALPDGSAIIAGGIGVDGNALASAEAFQQSTGFSAAPSMNAARGAHTCTTLQDGRILAVGGTDGQGLPVATAEIYDPVAQTWSLVADLNDPRWGHTATLLNDGRVLIAGGQDFYGPKDTLEVFDPVAAAFVQLDDRLSTPRMNHAAALLPDGLVAIMGGSNLVNSLSSVDLFVPGEVLGGDATDDTVIAAAPLQAARASLTANTLPDGTILVAGGFDGQQDLDTAEVYDINKGSFFALGNLNTARHGHLALMLPGNGNVAIIGGSGAGATLDSCELYNFPEGNFTSIGSLTSPRARTVAVPVAGGLVLSAGGVSTDGVTEVASSGVLTTPVVSFTLNAPLNDPFFGTLNITGSNFGDSQAVSLQLSISNHPPTRSQSINANATTGSKGAFSIVSPALKVEAESGMWTLTASTPGPPVLTASAKNTLILTEVNLTASCNPCTVGQTVMLTATLVNPTPAIFLGGSPANEFVQFIDATASVGKAVLVVPAAVMAGPAPVTIGTATVSEKLLSAGGHMISAAIQQTSGYVGASAPITVTANLTPTTVSVFANPNPVLSGKSSMLTAVVGMDPALAANAGAAPTGTISYTIDGRTRVPLPIGNSSLTFFPAPVPTLQQATHTITASYSGDANYAPSTSNPITLTVAQVLLPAISFYGYVLPHGLPLQWNIFPVEGQNTGFVFTFGESDWSPVTGDWTGSGTSSVGAFDPSTDTWHIGGIPANGSVDELFNFTFGTADCSMIPASGSNLIPVAGDWAGLGHAGVGVYDTSSGIWCLRNTASAGAPDAQFQFTVPGAFPVVGDWDGNGTTTVGLFEPTGNTWLLRNENSSGAPDADGGIIQFGTGPPGFPLTGNWSDSDPKKTGIGFVSGVPAVLLTQEDGASESFTLAGATITAGPVTGNISGVPLVSGKLCFTCVPSQ